MIFNNSTIEEKITTGGGFVNGIPQKSSEGWGKPIPCHIEANTNDHKGSVKEGNFKRMSFTIWLSNSFDKFYAKRIRLRSSEGIFLGEFEVQSIEHLRLVGRVKITV